MARQRTHLRACCCPSSTTRPRLSAWRHFLAAGRANVEGKDCGCSRKSSRAPLVCPTAGVHGHRVHGAITPHPPIRTASFSLLESQKAWELLGSLGGLRGWPDQRRQRVSLAAVPCSLVSPSGALWLCQTGDQRLLTTPSPPLQEACCRKAQAPKEVKGGCHE